MSQRNSRSTGYGWGTVLVSPSGERRRVNLRRRPGDRSDEESRRFHKLLSQGWVVEAPGGAPPRRYAPKGTSLVLPAGAKTSEDAHGGDSASGEVPDSPNEGG